MSTFGCFSSIAPAPTGEIVIHVIHFPVTTEKIIVHEHTIVVHASFDSRVDVIVQYLRGKYRIPCEIAVVFNGRILSQSEPIPVEGFEPSELIDSVSLIFRPRIAVIIQVDVTLPIADDGLGIVEVHDDPVEIDKVQQELRERQEQDLLHSRVAEQLQVSTQISKFDLFDQLLQIDCGMFYQILKNNGFDQEGSFSLLSENDFEELRLNIPKRAQNRILTLCDSIKHNLSTNRQTPKLEKLVPQKRAPKKLSPREPAEDCLFLEEKIKNIQQSMERKRAANDMLFTSTTTPHQVNAVCGSAHQEKVALRKKQLQMMNKVKFSSEISSRLEWLDMNSTIASGGEVPFGAFEEMFSIAWKILENWGLTNIPRDQAYHEIEKSAYLSTEEIREIESLYALHEHVDKCSIIGGYVFSKTKFVDAVVQFVDAVDPLFFLVDK